jgi:hypothetical protein
MAEKLRQMWEKLGPAHILIILAVAFDAACLACHYSLEKNKTARSISRPYCWAWA